MDNRYQAYRQGDINTANRGKIVVMLYSGAITFLNKSKVFMLRQDYENKSKYLQKGLDIIEELNVALDIPRGGEIAKNLRSIYLFLIRYLNEANIENSANKFDRAIQMLDRIKSAFEEITQNPEYAEAQSISKKEQLQNSISKVV